LPPDLQQKLENAIETSSGTVTVKLPASELVSSTHQVDIQNTRAVMSIPLEFTGQTAFELAARLNYLSDGTAGASLEEITQDLTRLRAISFLVCCAALLVVLIVLLLIAVITRRRRKYRVM